MWNANTVPAPLMVDMITCDGASKSKDASQICLSLHQIKIDPIKNNVTALAIHLVTAGAVFALVTKTALYF